MVVERRQAQRGWEYLVKWNSTSYHACTWVPERRLRELAPQKLKNYLQSAELHGGGVASDDRDDWQYGINPEFREPERVLSQRVGPQGLESAVEYLVKWRGLPHAQCTWESADWVFADETARTSLMHYKACVRPEFHPLLYAFRQRQLLAQEYAATAGLPPPATNKVRRQAHCCARARSCFALHC